MSTRGCVAVKMGNGWVGVYNHSDSYPTGLGKELWDHLKTQDLRAFAEELLRYDDWRNYLVGGTCPYCGQRGLSQPHSIRVSVRCVEMERNFRTKEEIRRHYQSLPAWSMRPEEVERAVEEEWEIIRNIRRTGYPDPKAKYHEHGPLQPAYLTSENPDPLFIEWVYVVDPEQRSFDILSSQGVRLDGPVRNGFAVPRKNGYFDYGHCKYRHVRVARVSLAGEEPNWQLLEEVTQKSLALEDAIREERLIFEQLKEGRISKDICLLCGRLALTYNREVAHERCLRMALERLGGDAETWIQGLKLEYKKCSER
ncbi:MAG: hypothetical protein QXQ66_08445 [Candidatus Hadarchaeum sp.]|uniref:hypothetical protein n=1 Tax=Candidatus Hadarchaeum sp. TaxID=2883567 RepID=UPI0031708BE5